MKSWRFTGTNEPLQLAELPEPTAGPGQVVVDVKAAGICHTDVGILTDPGWMTMLAQVPVTLGHEDAGVISQVGEGVDDFQVGDRAAICPTTPAGCPGSSFDGGFGPKIVVGTQALVRIPCFASMFVRQVRQCFSAVWADGFPRCRHRFPVM